MMELTQSASLALTPVKPAQTPLLPRAQCASAPQVSLPPGYCLIALALLTTTTMPTQHNQNAKCAPTRSV